MDARENNISDNNVKAIKNNLKPRADLISSKIDFSVTKGMKLFPLFERREDNYIFEKKFYNDLPKDLVFPKAFNLNSNINNFAKFDMMTMLFGLKKSQDLLTNPRLNTNIHQDFISNSLQLIFPENKIEFKNCKIKGITKGDSKKLDTFKQEILEIIDSKDESELKEKQINPRYEDAFYLRNTMILGSHLNINKKNYEKNSGNAISNSELIEKNKNNLKLQHEEYIKSIEKTFEESEKIYEGMQHPKKINVTAKNVYTVFPFFEFDENKFSQIIFPEDPSEKNNTEKNEYIEEKFILKNKTSQNNINDNQIFSLYKSETEDHNELEKIKEEYDYNNLLKSKVNFFNFDREYTGNIQNREEELFNRYLIFMSKRNKTAKILPLNTKLFLKKHKIAVQNPEYENDYENNYTNKHLNKKRERDIAIIPKNIELEEIKNRNNSFNNSGFLKHFSLKPEKIHNIELERIIKKRKRTESSNNDEDNEENDEKNNEDDLFGNEFNSNNEDEENNNSFIMDDDINNNDDDNHYEDKDYEEDINY